MTVVASAGLSRPSASPGGRSSASGRSTQGRSPSRSPQQQSVYRPAAASPSPSPPACLVRNPNADNSEALASLNAAYSKLRAAVEQRLPLYARGLQIRIRQWLEKLDEDKVTGNPTWARNRNSYVHLLNGHLRSGCLQKPFDAAPPPGPLPTLPKHLTYAFSKSTGSRAAGASPSSSSGSPLLRADASPGRGAPSKRGGARLQQPQEAAARTSPGGDRKPTPPPQATGPSPSPSPSSFVLPEPYRSPPAAQHKQPQPQPAAAEVHREALARMEWQLGASRERQLELEAQLASARASVRQQADEIGALRDQVAALRADNARLAAENAALAASAAAAAAEASAALAAAPPSPPPSAASPYAAADATTPGAARQCERREAREGLDRVISRVEATHQSWERQKPPAPSLGLQPYLSPANKAKARAKAGEEAPAPAAAAANISSSSAIANTSGSHGASWEFDGDDDFLRHLEEFQKRTDALQGQIARMHVSNAAASRPAA